MVGRSLSVSNVNPFHAMLVDVNSSSPFFILFLNSCQCDLIFSDSKSINAHLEHCSSTDFSTAPRAPSGDVFLCSLNYVSQIFGRRLSNPADAPTGGSKFSANYSD